MVLGIFLISATSVAAYVGARYVGQKVQRRLQLVLLAVSLILGLVYVLFLRDSMWQICMIRSLNTIVYGKWLLIIAGLSCGILSCISSIHKVSRAVLCILLLGASAMDFMVYFVLPRPGMTDVRTEWLIGQSTDASCAAAAAASLLRLHQIEVSEEDMAKACLTTVTGTPVQGIWRGLKLHAKDRYAVQLVRYDNHNEIQFPLLIMVELNSRSNEYKKYYEEWGWAPGRRRRPRVRH